MPLVGWKRQPSKSTKTQSHASIIDFNTLVYLCDCVWPKILNKLKKKKIGQQLEFKYP